MNKKINKIVVIGGLLLIAAAVIFIAFKSKNGNNSGTEAPTQKEPATQVNEPAITEETKSQQPDETYPADNAPKNINTTQETQIKRRNESSCIVTINGSGYDVTTYKSQHPGGDIFKCGTDMTAVFYSQHNDSTLRKMQKYLVN